MITRLADGLRLALTTFTVLPLPPGRLDRRTAAVAMSAAPLVGALLGAALGALALALRALALPAAPLAVVLVAATAAATRALHLDGLADTVDGLGATRDRTRALDIMKRSDIGPFGVVAIVLTLAAQVTALTAITHRPPLALLTTLIAATATGRLAVTWSCRRGIPAARPTGLGALVAGTVPLAAPLAATAALALIAVLAVPHRPWQGPLAVLTATAAAFLLTRHATRRLGGITGDTLGAAVELATTITLLMTAFGAA